jgi:Zn-dependent protease
VTIRGVRFSVHYSWYIVFVLLSYGLAKSYFPYAIKIYINPISYALLGVIATVVLFLSVVAHEIAHAFVAYLRGIKTESITLYFFGGVAELDRESHDADSDFYISLAGPVMSLLLAGVFRVFSVSPLDHYLYTMNLMIGVFNIMPVFPLDGGRILRSLAWKFRRKGYLDALEFSVVWGRYMLYALISGCLLWFILKGEGLMMLIIFGMVHFISDLYYKDIKAVRTNHYRVKDMYISRDRMISVDVAATMEEFYNRFLVYGYHGYPVTDNGRVVGLITYWFIKKNQSLLVDGAATKVKDIYEPLKDSMTIDENASVAEALEKMYLKKRERLFVYVRAGDYGADYQVCYQQAVSR